MYTFSLQSFIKICQLDTGSRIAEIQKKLDSTGGYDFYNSFQRATKCRLTTLDKGEVSDILDAPSKEIERQHNRVAYNKLIEKFGSIKTLEHINNPKKLKFKNEDIEILINPLFGFTKSGGQQVHAVWPTQKPKLSQRYGAVACYIMRETYKNSGLANSQFFFTDLVGDKTYSEKQITNNTSLILSADISSISALIRQL